MAKSCTLGAKDELVPEQAAATSVPSGDTARPSTAAETVATGLLPMVPSGAMR